VEYIEDFGKPQSRKLFTLEEKWESYRKFPTDLFIDEYGTYLFDGGLIQLCHPGDHKGNLALVFKADAEFSHRNCNVYAYSAFERLSKAGCRRSPAATTLPGLR
jgi:hypothetical protein